MYGIDKQVGSGFALVALVLIPIHSPIHKPSDVLRGRSIPTTKLVEKWQEFIDGNGHQYIIDENLFCVSKYCLLFHKLTDLPNQ